MKRMLIMGILLMGLGAVSLAYEGITYKSDEEKVELGPIKITAEETKRIPLPPVLGTVALAGGAIMTIAGMRRP